MSKKNIKIDKKTKGIGVTIWNHDAWIMPMVVEGTPEETREIVEEFVNPEEWNKLTYKTDIISRKDLENFPEWAP